ncbi:uncharacterized protein VDAG_08333 [Verticillium dahliae VdLs.17]|uniref:Uncharacterized protein n=1 Tax=Verticillium dahliae (strain VdLs.17 / ATCC MYA-4575 / FGSC 10137) TaxID=498257 RepID=G2XDV1_VERDV|nr:uncharacterized protein VDAG_08333 [Verticillium dahliae VdLs.17]EGY17999.1 hypothetical protein VDAG_08333 [Verticillium dahliae VdLs.17]KAH6698737.1 hypothetical protein EV126DRAFT_425086 [Verticillium dahliae]
MSILGVARRNPSQQSQWSPRHASKPAAVSSKGRRASGYFSIRTLCQLIDATQIADAMRFWHCSDGAQREKPCLLSQQRQTWYRDQYDSHPPRAFTSQMAVSGANLDAF